MKAKKEVRGVDDEDLLAVAPSDRPLDLSQSKPLADVKDFMQRTQPLTAGILTQDGWKAMGDIQEGDLVVSIFVPFRDVAQRAAKPARVMCVESQGIQAVYRVKYESGAQTRYGSSGLLDFQRVESLYKLVTLRLGSNLKHPVCDRIRSIDYVGEQETRYIVVDHPSHLYVTDDYIVTHDAFFCEDND